MAETTIMQVVRAGAFCFRRMFGAGFVLGTHLNNMGRSRVGTRMIELMEMPIMHMVTIRGGSVMAPASPGVAYPLLRTEKCGYRRVSS